MTDNKAVCSQIVKIAQIVWITQIVKIAQIYWISQIVLIAQNYQILQIDEIVQSLQRLAKCLCIKEDLQVLLSPRVWESINFHVLKMLTQPKRNWLIPVLLVIVTHSGHLFYQKITKIATYGTWPPLKCHGCYLTDAKF